MAAVGCLLPFVLLGLGAVIGAAAGGTIGAYWGCGIGLAIGLLAMAFGVRVLERIRTARE
ncbi:MAG: hypothetical protein BGO51_27840 [Rhodospirillales bacterium 69-11]|nr:hypothetical protein [Rhodospirillales bacterium]OJW25139.1 MAG: hypothetical protein BGO51_27840 [Rhodospirillales bacterium 69-11]